MARVVVITAARLSAGRRGSAKNARAPGGRLNPARCTPRWHRPTTAAPKTPILRAHLVAVHAMRGSALSLRRIAFAGYCRAAMRGAPARPPPTPGGTIRRADDSGKPAGNASHGVPSGPGGAWVSQKGIAGGLTPFLSNVKRIFDALSLKLKSLGQDRPLFRNCDRPGASARYSKKPGKSLPDQRAIERA